MSGQIADFLTAFEHVDNDKICVMSSGIGLEVFQAAQDLAGEGAAEVPQKYQHQQPGLGGLCQGLPRGEVENLSCIAHGVGPGPDMSLTSARVMSSSKFTAYPAASVFAS